MRESIGSYALVRKLGEGGMGVVYEARDQRLDRLVALKTLRVPGDETERRRIEREARAAASVNHPNVCQIFEVGEDAGEFFFTMELLEGESLGARVERGPIPLNDSLQISLGMLSALEALHRRGIVHRDLKPSNVFLTPHGVKLLDFGLALPVSGNINQTDLRLTATGAIVGTPRYMAPEQWTGGPIGPATDLFALGALLFEMLSGRQAFAGNSVVEVFHSITYEQPPALAGGPGIVAVDRLIHKALEKSPANRYPDAPSMARDVRAALVPIDSGEAPRVRAMKRLVVLPLRVLRPDPDIDFLSFGLAEAISLSLSGLDSLVVRSSFAAARFAGPNPDLKAIAAETEVDVVLMGTLLRAGDEVRVSSQLVEAPAGTVVWSHVAQASLRDLFALQDELSHKIVESLAIPLATHQGQSLQHDVPAAPEAYQAYLRANQLSHDPRRLPEARDQYRACLDADPSYAPAWARLGRAYRVIAKYGTEDVDVDENLRLAENAFRRALEINPDLSLAHNLFTYHEVEKLGRAPQAMVRLLERARARASDPELFAGLVLACRFCGLLEASVAADERARRLDPTIATSVHFTYWMMGDYERAMLRDDQTIRYISNFALPMLGREADAIASLREQEARGLEGIVRLMFQSARAALEGNREECVAASRAVAASRFWDPEGLLFMARNMARVGETASALALLDRVVRSGFFCDSTLARDPWLDPLRAAPEFGRALRYAEERRAEAAASFTRAGGERILGSPAR